MEMEERGNLGDIETGTDGAELLVEAGKHAVAVVVGKSAVAGPLLSWHSVTSVCC